MNFVTFSWRMVFVIAFALYVRRHICAHFRDHFREHFRGGICGSKFAFACSGLPPDSQILRDIERYRDKQPSDSTSKAVNLKSLCEFMRGSASTSDSQILRNIDIYRGEQPSDSTSTAVNRQVDV